MQLAKATVRQFSSIYAPRKCVSLAAFVKILFFKKCRTKILRQIARPPCSSEHLVYGSVQIISASAYGDVWLILLGYSAYPGI